MATFTKLLPVHGNGWGIEGTTQEMVQGAFVNVQRRDGSVRILRVGEILWQGEGRAVARIDETGQVAPAPNVAYGNGNGHASNGNGHSAHNGNGNTPQAPQAPVPPPTPPNPPQSPSTPSTPTTHTMPVAQTVQAQVESTGQIAHKAISALAARQIGATDEQEGKVRRLAHVADTLRGDVYQVNYYIPSALDDKVDNPSRIFRRHGFRLDGSNWVFPEKGLNHKDVQEVLRSWDTLVPMEQQSSIGITSRITVRYWVIQYTKEQLCAMKELAQSQLADELQKTHRSLIERIDSAAQDLKTAQDALDADDNATEKDRSKIDSSYNGRIRASITEACERFEMCLKGAELFDDTGSLDALFGAVRDAIRTQAIAANVMLRKKQVKQVSIPASILG